MVNSFKSKSGVLLSVAVSGAMVAAAIGGSPTAAADCASFFGLGNTANCQSGPASIAIAVGPNATATAGGLFGVAFALGRIPLIGTANTGVATATTSGAFTSAWAWGDNVTAQAGDLFGFATQWGTNGTTITKGFGNIAQAISNPFGSSTVDIGMTVANGVGNLITNGALFSAPGSSVEAVGFWNYAFNGWGSNNVVKAGGTPTSFFNVAFDAFNGGDVIAGPGPFAIAIAFGRAPGDTTSQVGPGINVKVGNAQPAFPASAASSRASKKVSPKSMAGAGSGSGKKSGVASGARPAKKSD